MGAIKKGVTYGHVRQTATQNRIYWKPSLRRWIIRTPGVIRSSDKVLERNKKVRANPPATKCAGLSFADGSFQKCLREQMLKL